MDAPHDPHNGAAVLRSCDAFGVQEVHVVARQEPFRAADIVSKGSQKWVDAKSYENVPEALAQLEGCELVGTHPQGSLQPEQLATIPKLAPVMGKRARRHMPRAAGHLPALRPDTDAGLCGKPQRQCF